MKYCLVSWRGGGKIDIKEGSRAMLEDNPCVAFIIECEADSLEEATQKLKVELGSRLGLIGG